MIVAPSILSADFSDLARDCQSVTDAGAEFLHIDVMDGCFVPNITIGPCVIKSLRAKSDAVFDVHLMIDRPERYIGDFLDAGADYLTFHIESTADVGACIDAVRARGKKVGLTLKPATPVEKLFAYLDRIDMALVMTVEPGFGGQKFMADMLPKIEALADERERRGLSYLIEADGGVNPDNAPLLARAGCDVVVAGSAVFGAQNREQAVISLKNCLK